MLKQKSPRAQICLWTKNNPVKEIRESFRNDSSICSGVAFSKQLIDRRTRASMSKFLFVSKLSSTVIQFVVSYQM